MASRGSITLREVALERYYYTQEENVATQANLITVEQYLESFEGYPGLRDELINGRIVMTPQPKPLHQHIVRNLQGLLDIACKGTDYIVNGDSNIKFQNSNSAPAPDVFVVESSKWREAIINGTYLDTPPLIAVEILSPSQADLNEKIDIYLEAGVAVLWIVDPKNRTVLIHTGQRESFYQKDHDEIDLPKPLNGSVKLADIFAGLPETPSPA